MRADFYAAYLSQDTTGQLVRTYGEPDPDADPQEIFPVRLATYSNISVEARGLGNLRGKDSGTAEVYKNIYQMMDFIRVKTMQQVDESYRIGNIRDASGSIAWTEPDGSATLFDIVGVTPSFDPFGQFMEYEIFCNRAQAQTFYTGTSNMESTR